jgi:ankyrin repeat protein
MSSLHTACNALHFPTILENVIQGVNLNAMNLLGETPLSCVITNSYKSPERATLCVSLLLLAGADPNLHQEGSFTPLMLAAIYKHTAILKLLLEYKADVNSVYTPPETTFIPFGSSALSIAFLMQNDIAFLIPLVNRLHNPYILAAAFRYCSPPTYTLLSNYMSLLFGNS